ncbi:hypothetical protein GEMRC1_001637 [Eukaryota sp. GEM-RC1]
MKAPGNLSAAAALSVLQLELRTIDRERAEFDSQQKQFNETTTSLQTALNKANQANSLLARDISVLETTLKEEREKYAELLANQRASIELTLPKTTSVMSTPQPQHSMPSADRELLSLFPSLSTSLLDVLRILVANSSDSAKSAISLVISSLGLSAAHGSAIRERLIASPQPTLTVLAASPDKLPPSPVSSPCNPDGTNTTPYRTPIDSSELVSPCTESFPVNVSLIDEPEEPPTNSYNDEKEICSLLSDLGVSTDFSNTDYTSFQCSAALRGHLAAVRTVQFAPNSNSFLSGGEDGLIQLWSASVALPSSSNVNYKPLAILRGSESPVLTSCFLNNGEKVLAGSLDGSVHLFDLPTADPFPECKTGLPYYSGCLFKHADAVWQVSAHPSHDDIVASCGADGTVVFYDLSKISEEQSLGIGMDGISVVPLKPGLSTLSFMPCYIHLLAVACEQMVQFVDLSRLEVTSSLELPLEDPSTTISTLTSHPKTCLMATAMTDGSICLIDTRQPRLIWRKKVHAESCSDVTFLGSNPNILVSSSHDSTLRLTALDGSMISDIPSHHVVNQDASIWGICTHSNSSLIATAGADSVVRLFNL